MRWYCFALRLKFYHNAVEASKTFVLCIIPISGIAAHKRQPQEKKIWKTSHIFLNAKNIHSMTWHIICQQVTNYKENKPLKTQYFHFDFFFLYFYNISFNLLSQLNSQVVKDLSLGLIVQCSTGVDLYIYFLIDSW